jgi:small subunit ribosomal protein S16
LRKGAQPTEQVQKLLTVSGVWAQFESEKGGRVDTKLARRRLDDPKAAAKRAKKAEPAEAAAPEAGAPAAAEQPAAEENAADESAGEGTEESNDE